MNFATVKKKAEFLNTTDAKELTKMLKEEVQIKKIPELYSLPFSTASFIISELLSKYSSNPTFCHFFYNLVEIPPQTLMVMG